MKIAVQINNEEQLKRFVKWADEINKDTFADYALKQSFNFPHGFTICNQYNDKAGSNTNLSWYRKEGYKILSFSDFEKEYLKGTKETFEYGEVVEVSDFGDWYKRIFLCILPGKAYQPVRVVSSSNEKEFKEGREYETRGWKHVRKIQKPKWEPIHIDVPDTGYTAVILEDNLKFGCKHISFEVAHKIHDAILKAEEFKRDNP